MDADHQLNESSTGSNGDMVKTDELGTRINDADNDIEDDVRDRYHAKLVMYGSTQTHSIGAKVSQSYSIAESLVLCADGNSRVHRDRRPRSWG